MMLITVSLSKSEQTISDDLMRKVGAEDFSQLVKLSLGMLAHLVANADAEGCVQIGESRIKVTK